VLLAVGLFSRTTAFILSGELAFAYWIGHAPRGFFPILNAGELAALYSFVFLYLAAAGPGPWSLDRALNDRQRGSAEPGRANEKPRQLPTTGEAPGGAAPSREEGAPTRSPPI
jgi:hypothetical protein